MLQIPNQRNPRFRQFRKIEIDKRVRTWYDLIIEEIHIAGKETK